MPTLTIRNVPVEVVDRIKQTASRQQHSMEEEVRETLASCYADREALDRDIRASHRRQFRPVSAADVDAGKRFGRK